MSFSTFFSGGPIARESHVRVDAAALNAALTDADARFVAVWQSRCMVSNGAAVLLRRDELGSDWSDSQCIYLGRNGTQPMFAISLTDERSTSGIQAEAFESFRGLMSGLDANDAALLAYAKGMTEWHLRHRYCSVCGSQSDSTEGGFVRLCSDPACAHRSFPRIDPAIIVLATHSGRCLLGQQATWPEGRYSTIAGFAEPGESLEDAVRREVLEETNINIGNTVYRGSQPWPFPSALMIGFHAEALSTAITLNDGELSDARWFSPTDIASGDILLPPPTSIAFALIEAWFDQNHDRPLASLGLSGDFSSSGRTRT